MRPYPRMLHRGDERQIVQTEDIGERMVQADGWTYSHGEPIGKYLSPPLPSAPLGTDDAPSSSEASGDEAAADVQPVKRGPGRPRKEA